VQFIANSGSYGPALSAYNSSIIFNGPVIVADNIAREGAGGAFSLTISEVTFDAVATVRNNTLDWCTMVSARHQAAICSMPVHMLC
jgi:hypothetical protein